MISVVKCAMVMVIFCFMVVTITLFFSFSTVPRPFEWFNEYRLGEQLPVASRCDYSQPPYYFRVTICTVNKAKSTIFLTSSDGMRRINRVSYTFSEPRPTVGQIEAFYGEPDFINLDDWMGELFWESGMTVYVTADDLSPASPVYLVAFGEIADTAKEFRWRGHRTK